jgi:hypothetical protein
MKSNKILAKASLLFSLLIVLLLVTCKKDNTNLSSDYRIIKSIYYYDQVQFDSMLYEYEDNRMSAILGYNNNGEESSMVSIEYSDNDSIVLVFSYYMDTSMVVEAKKVLKLDGSHVIEVIYYEADDVLWKPSSKLTYSYENDNLVEFIEYDDQSGDWMPNDKTVYEYDGPKHLQTTRYKYANGWQTWEKLVFTYIDNKVDYVLGYVYDDGSVIETYKTGFSYEGDLMKSCTDYSNDSGSWIPTGSILYTYDSYNNLESYSFPIDELTYKVEYEYEQGSGNYMQLLDYYEYDFFLGIEPHPTKAAERDSIPIFINFGKNSCQ